MPGESALETVALHTRGFNMSINSEFFVECLKHVAMLVDSNKDPLVFDFCCGDATD